MNRISILLALVAILSSCSNSSDDKEQMNDQLYDAVFNVSTFDQEIIDLKSSQTLSSVVNYLHYFVFTTSGQLIYRKEYKHSDNNFGIIKDKLAEGDYKIVFLGMHDPITDEEEDLDGNYLESDRFQFKDTYHKCIDVSIPNDDLEQSIQLDRIVGKIEVIFTDKIPSEVASIDYVLMNVPTEIDLVNINSFSSQYVKNSKTISISENDKEQANYQLNIYEISEDIGYTCGLVINYYDAQGVISGSKKITDIRIFRNKITRLKGNIFSENGDNLNKFSLVVDTDWSEVIERTF